MRPGRFEDDASEVARLARELPRVKLAHPERLRRELLEKAAAGRSRRKVARWIAPAGALAAGLALFALASDRSSPIPAEPERSHAMIAVVRPALFSQRFERRGEELVELRDGRVRFDVNKLERGERFVVRAGDAEVEVRGTSFDVDVSRGRLREVIVHEGVVAVRSGGKETLVRGGERWPHEEVAAEAPPVPAPPRPKAAPRAKAKDRFETEFGAGWEAMRNRDGQAAAKAFERASSEGALAEDAAFWRAVSLSKTGETAKAIEAFLSFMERFPSSPRRGEAAVIAAWHLLDRRDPRAEKYFQIGLLDPKPEVRSSAEAGLAALQTP